MFESLQPTEGEKRYMILIGLLVVGALLFTFVDQGIGELVLGFAVLIASGLLPRMRQYIDEKLGGFATQGE